MPDNINKTADFSWPGAFFSALTFLSRLGPGRRFTASEMKAGLAFYGLAGLFLGCVCVFCALGIQSLPPFQSIPLSPAIQALLCGAIWLCAEIWLTRGLHWDGVADMGDALGSRAAGAKFHAILKDSRIGAFGVLALCQLLLLQWLGAVLHFAFASIPASLPALALAPAWSRLAPIWMAPYVQPFSRPSLAAFICDSASHKIWLGAIIQGVIILGCLLILGIAISRLAALLILQIALIAWLCRLARRHNGVSGDFFGCLIEFSQTIFLIACL